eukprot:4202553-Pyramimonas_sp.AAC.1
MGTVLHRCLRRPRKIVKSHVAVTESSRRPRRKVPKCPLDNIPRTCRKGGRQGRGKPQQQQ